MIEMEDGPGDRDEDERPGNPYAMALRLIRDGGAWATRALAAERACATLILAYAKGPEHVDWGDVQAALEEAMAAYGLSVHEDGSSLVLAPPPARAERRFPGPKPVAANRPRAEAASIQGTSSVFRRGGEWWFYDEADSESGPFADAVDAHLGMAIHLELLERGPEKIWQRMGERAGNFIAKRVRS